MKLNAKGPKDSALRMQRVGGICNAPALLCRTIIVTSATPECSGSTAQKILLKYVQFWSDCYLAKWQNINIVEH